MDAIQFLFYKRLRLGLSRPDVLDCCRRFDIE
jgi:hypothetical protein